MEGSSCIFCGKTNSTNHLALCTNFYKFKAKRHLAVRVPQFNLASFESFKEIAVGIKIL